MVTLKLRKHAEHKDMVEVVYELDRHKHVMSSTWAFAVVHIEMLSEDPDIIAALEEHGQVDVALKLL